MLVFHKKLRGEGKVWEQEREGLKEPRKRRTRSRGQKEMTARRTERQRGAGFLMSERERTRERVWKETKRGSD